MHAILRRAASSIVTTLSSFPSIAEQRPSVVVLYLCSKQRSLATLEPSLPTLEPYACFVPQAIMLLGSRSVVMSSVFSTWMNLEAQQQER